MICQKCYKSEAVLAALGKCINVDGYLQCKDCGSDLEYESVVIRQIHFNKERSDGIPLPEWLHNDLKKKGLLRKIKTSIPKHQQVSKKILEKLLKQ